MIEEHIGLHLHRRYFDEEAWEAMQSLVIFGKNLNSFHIIRFLFQFHNNIARTMRELNSQKQLKYIYHECQQKVIFCYFCQQWFILNVKDWQRDRQLAKNTFVRGATKKLSRPQYLHIHCRGVVGDVKSLLAEVCSRVV